MAAEKDSGYVVKGALIQVSDPNGKIHQLHYGVGVPGYVDADELSRLEGLGLIVKPGKDDAPVPATLPKAVDL